MDKKYLIGVDVGTTSQKVAVFDTDGNTVSAVTVDYVLDAKGNTVEFDAAEYISILRRGLTLAAQEAFPGDGAFWGCPFGPFPLPRWKNWPDFWICAAIGPA